MEENPPMNEFTFVDTTATKKVFALTKRIRAVAGGTSASKTISILVWCIDYCQSSKNRDKLISIVSESYPHLEKGAILDFQKIMKDRGYWKSERWHDTRHTYTFETGNKLEFMSPDTYGKAHGPRRDVLFMNEANHIDWIIADQLMTRTREIVWMDWNPTIEFWFYTEILGKRDDVDFITLTYRDNEALDAGTIHEIESHRENKNWWHVYGEGQLGQLSGQIYRDWKTISEIPHEARLVAYGLDYGYTNDPTAIVAIHYLNGGYIIEEVAYQRSLTNKMIADIISSLPVAPVYPDSAEPKSNDELRSYGLTVIPVKKGAGSVQQGIQFVQSNRISVTERSVNVLKEYRNYVWKTDKLGNPINEPEHEFSHSMDAIRYGLQVNYKPKDKKPFKQPEYERPGI